MNTTGAEWERRDFLKVTALAGVALLVGCRMTGSPPSLTATAHSPDERSNILEPNAWIRIDSDDTVTVMVNHSEMGQGITTALSMIVAEELEADWDKVRAEIAPVATVYNNPKFGVQATGGSTSVRTCWETLRKAGAAARELLRAAAASEWGVSLRYCHVTKGTVVHKASGRVLRFGQLIDKGAKTPLPSRVKLKKLSEFNIIGKRIKRLDSRAKARGVTIFGVDVSLPRLLTATVVHPPVFGGSVRSFNDSKARSVKGVRHVGKVESGVAVVADKFWQAKKAADLLKIEWDTGALANLSSEEIKARWAKLALEDGDRIRDDGDVDGAISESARVMKAVYELPFQAHGCPEPMNCTADVREDGCDVWVPTQNQTGVQETASVLTGLDLDSIRVHTTFIGGGFGRRGDVDFVREAVQLSQAVKAPVKVIWTREEDMTHDSYRPASYHVVRAGLDKKGMPVALSHRLVCPSYVEAMIETMAPSVMPKWLPRPLKYTAAAAAAPVVKHLRRGESATSGAWDTAYAIDNLRVEYIRDDPGIPVGAWRSVADSRNAFVVESFVDEIACATGKDPYQLRYDLLRNEPKRRGVLKLAAEKAGWRRKASAGLYRGIAVHDFHGTPVAMVAEISVAAKGRVKVHRVVCAVDCGIVINPKIVEAQMAGGIAFGITATLKSSVTIKGGRAEQRNFDDFPLLRMDEMPELEVHIVPSTDPPTGIGEVAVPAIAPAIANAVYAATGKRVRKLPIGPQDLI